MNSTLDIFIRNKKFTFDSKDFDKLCINNSDSTAIIRWKLDNKLRPYHLDNNQKHIYLINKILDEKTENRIIFKDGNIFNYSKNNIQIDEDEIIYFNENIYKILKIIKGHKSKLGKSAGIIKNQIFKCINLENNNKLYLMKCNSNYTLISKEDIDKIQHFNNQILTWYKLSNGYIGSHVKINNKDTIIYLHQHLLDYYGHGLGKNIKTIDHINRNKLDNRLENLRIISQAEQNKNTNKRNRKYNAKELPKGVTQDMIPKYVVYYKECYNKDKNLYREFFKIENHPKINKSICSSKSCKYSILEKLEEITNIINKINNNLPFEKEKKLPKYYSIKKLKTSNSLVFDRKFNGKRYSMKMKMTSDNIEDELQKLSTKLKEKYLDLEI